MAEPLRIPATLNELVGTVLSAPVVGLLEELVEVVEFHHMVVVEDVMVEAGVIVNVAEIVEVPVVVEL
jgi:hypothetical protein